MTENALLLRCGSCGTVNKVPAERIVDRPKCGRCKALLDFPRTPVEVTTAGFEREVTGHPGHVLVFFWASWCAHCRGMFPVLQDIARQRAGKLKVAMINTEREPVLAQRFNVMSVPRLTLYHGGIIVSEINGAVGKAELDAWIERLTGSR